MSIGPLNLIAASIAGTPLAQTKGAEVDQAQQDVGAQEFRIQAEEKAAMAAGIGEADGQDHQTDQRDADGRLPWKLSNAKHEETSDSQEKSPPPSIDPSGQSGTMLDLSG